MADVRDEGGKVVVWVVAEDWVEVGSAIKKQRRKNGTD